jgi:hypothetical protein
MINSPAPETAAGASDDAAVDAIVEAGPLGAVTVAGIATAIVIALWFAFYWLVFLPRSAG